MKHPATFSSDPLTAGSSFFADVRCALSAKELVMRPWPVVLAGSGYTGCSLRGWEVLRPWRGELVDGWLTVNRGVS